jgi:hypothetical protein
MPLPLPLPLPLLNSVNGCNALSIQNIPTCSTFLYLALPCSNSVSVFILTISHGIAYCVMLCALFSRLSVLKDPKSFAVVTDALRACTEPTSSASSSLAPPRSSGPGSSGTGSRRTGQQSSSSAGSRAGIGSKLAEAEGGGEELKLGAWVALRQLQRMSKALSNMGLFKGTVLPRRPAARHPFCLPSVPCCAHCLLRCLS